MDFRRSLRKKLNDYRKSLLPYDQNLASYNVARRLIKIPQFHKSQHIAAYLAINQEINPKIIIKTAWEQHKNCYLPVVRKKQLIFSLYTKSTPLNKKQFGLFEPLSIYNIEPYNLDLVLVPLLGFTIQGARLGMGGGFYDRSFSFLLNKKKIVKPYLIGLAYEWQKLEFFEPTMWDVPLNAIVTENQIYFNPDIINSFKS